jgi:hypothetical protein
MGQQLWLIAERASAPTKLSCPSYAQRASWRASATDCGLSCRRKESADQTAQIKVHQLRWPAPLSFPGAICGPPTGPIERTSSVMHPVQLARALPLPGGGTLRPFRDTVRKSASVTAVVYFYTPTAIIRISSPEAKFRTTEKSNQNKQPGNRTIDPNPDPNGARTTKPVSQKL